MLRSTRFTSFLLLAALALLVLPGAALAGNPDDQSAMDKKYDDVAADGTDDTTSTDTADELTDSPTTDVYDKYPKVPLPPPADCDPVKDKGCDGGGDCIDGDKCETPPVDECIDGKDDKGGACDTPPACEGDDCDEAPPVCEDDVVGGGNADGDDPVVCGGGGDAPLPDFPVVDGGGETTPDTVLGGGEMPLAATPVTAAVGGGEDLPFTGGPVGIAVGLAMILLASGTVAWWRGRPASDEA